MSSVVIITFSTNKLNFLRYLGPYQVAWYLRQQNYDCQVLDFVNYMSSDQRLSLYKKFITEETKIVGWAPFPFGHQTKSTDLLLEIKENFPWVKIVIGGVHSKWFLNQGYKLVNFKVDAVFKGQGEYTFTEYCDYIFKKNTKHPVFELVNGLKVIYPTREYQIESCRMKFEERDFIMEGESLPLELGRGCIFKCKFCQYPHIGKDKDDFNRSLENIKESLEYHFNNFGTTRYTIIDDTLNSHRARTKRLLEISKNLPFKLEFGGYVRLDLIDIWPEQQEILPEAGLISCHFGIESLDPYSCKMVGKGWGAKNHRTFLEKISKDWHEKVMIRCSLIAGLGIETEKDWINTHNWFKNSNIPDWKYIPLALYHEEKLSEFERNAQQYGYYWPDPAKDPTYWENGVTNYYEAKKFCQQINIESESYKIPASWKYIAFQNLGFSPEEIKSNNIADLSKLIKNGNRIKNFVDKYYQKAINYEVKQ